MALSKRGRRSVKPGLPYFSLFFEGVERGLHSAANPDGYVLLAVAENRLCYEAMAIEKLASVRASAIDADTGAYTNMSGGAKLRSAWAAYASRTVARRRQRVEPEHLVVGSGVGAIINNLSMLLCEPGDGVLLPTPAYAALYNDFAVLAECVVVDVPTAAPAFALTEQLLDAAAARAQRTGTLCRMLFLMNPNNPLGTVYSRDELRLCVRWAREQGLHLVVDEIYANSCWGADDAAAGDAAVAADASTAVAAAGRKPERFVSIVDVVAEMAEEEGGAEKETFGMGRDVHVLWGASKDLGMSGYRVGVLYSRNADVLAAFSNIGYFQTCSNDTQDMLAAVLRDEAWTDRYLAESRRLLRASYEALTALLEEARIPFVRACAAMFVWVDLREFLSPAPDRADPFSAERALTQRLFDECKILFTPGEPQHAPEPGFYRICYAYAPIEGVRAAFERLGRFAARLRAERASAS